MHKNAPFIYAAVGYNDSWLRNSEKFSARNITSYTQKGGLFYDVGLGYKISLNPKMSIGMSAGYSYKDQSEMVKMTLPFEQCIPPPPVLKPDTYFYQLRRISLKLHCWFL